MSGESQRDYRHAVPKTTARDRAAPQPDVPGVRRLTQPAMQRRERPHRPEQTDEGHAQMNG